MYLLLDFLSIKYSNMGGLFTKVAYTPPSTQLRPLVQALVDPIPPEVTVNTLLVLDS